MNESKNEGKGTENEGKKATTKPFSEDIARFSAAERRRQIRQTENACRRIGKTSSWLLALRSTWSSENGADSEKRGALGVQKDTQQKPRRCTLPKTQKAHLRLMHAQENNPKSWTAFILVKLFSFPLENESSSPEEKVPIG
ncbi:hypothetical protein CDAR_512081 [Caerostris darwini]|uniref:Uncharacterized protein n=1 Tax=Caerostris darwini TaxID=1538125 RepID=A0AAV4WHA1_9ARAC|nr:hypothetical protein CDAR_512081 [Caerostris darwini]